MKTPLSRQDIRNVVVILAGSRTGSSFLFHSLVRNALFLAPTGEETAYYRQVGLGIFNSPHYCDSLFSPPSPGVLDRYFLALQQDSGLFNPEAPVEHRHFPTFLHRLLLQWPQLAAKNLKSELKGVFESTLSSAHNPLDWSSIYLDFVAQLQARDYPVTVDLFSTTSSHPQNLSLLEEPPYITPIAQTAITQDLAKNHSLLLKTSTSIYRLPFLKALFPHAEFKWIVLQRNPAATISALMDGWLSTAFHSHSVHPHARLRIKGYSDTLPGGDHFWKFDMPPGWQAYTDAPLEEVCAFQWSSAYKQIDEFLNDTTDSFHTLSYEQLVANPRQELESICSFAGVNERHNSHSSQWLKPVASVHPPLSGKWKKRADILLPLLRGHDHGKLLQLAERFHYNIGAPETWT